MGFSRYLVLLTAVITFMVIASFSSAPYVAGDWTLSYREQVQKRLSAAVYNDLSSRLTPERLAEDLPCRSPPQGTRVDNDTLAGYLYAVYAIEDYNRPPHVRAVENILMRAMLMFDRIPIPDWSLGALQIKPSTAMQHLAAVGGPEDGTSRDAARLLLDACTHGQIGMSLIASILGTCSTDEDRHVCFARAYNGNARNPSGPTYADALQWLLRVSEPVSLIDGSETRAPDRSASAIVPRAADEAINNALSLLAVAREMQAGLPDGSAPVATWLRANRRYADQLSQALAARRKLCDLEPILEICADLSALSAETAQSWRSIIGVIEASDAMGPGADPFGPASQAVEHMAWSLVQDPPLRLQFGAGELDRIGALLARGTARFSAQNPRYILTETAFDCVRRSPELSISDLVTVPIDATTSQRDAALRCMRAFLSRLLSSVDR